MILTAKKNNLIVLTAGERNWLNLSPFSHTSPIGRTARLKKQVWKDGRNAVIHTCFFQYSDKQQQAFVHILTFFHSQDDEVHRHRRRRVPRLCTGARFPSAIVPLLRLQRRVREDLRLCVSRHDLLRPTGHAMPVQPNAGLLSHQ